MRTNEPESIQQTVELLTPQAVWYPVDSKNPETDPSKMVDPTIGIGHSIKTKEELELYSEDGISDEDALELFAKDRMEKEEAVKENVTVQLTQNQFDALVSFTYNIGVDGFKASETLSQLNQGNYLAAGIAMEGWLIPRTLINRRRNEIHLFIFNDYEKDY